jgi:hypothetical protein
MDAATFVYLAENQDRSVMKIGTSVRPYVRVTGLQFSAWLCLGAQYGQFRLVALLPGDKVMERGILDKFSDLKIGDHRREWLKHSRRVKNYFMSMGAMKPEKLERKRGSGRPPSLTECPYCHDPVRGVAALRNHLPRCPKRKMAA